MDLARIAELLAPFLKPDHSSRSWERGEEACTLLSPTQLQSISTYIDMLQRWNTRINLTAIRDEEEIVTRHFGESLFAARHLFPQDGYETTVLQGRAEGEKAGPSISGAKVADVGSGAGFPGIPIKLWAPAVSLTLIESNHKKATFLREVTRALTLTNINIQNKRAESLSDTHFDVVTLRAVEQFEKILPAAARLLAPAGRLALLIGQAQFPVAQAALPNLSWQSLIPIPGSQSRAVAQAQKG